MPISRGRAATPHSIRACNSTSVSLCDAKDVAQVFQLGPEFEEVVNLAVEDDEVSAIGSAHRLPARFASDRGSTAGDDTEWPRLRTTGDAAAQLEIVRRRQQPTVIVRPAMAEQTQQGLADGLRFLCRSDRSIRRCRTWYSPPVMIFSHPWVRLTVIDAGCFQKLVEGQVEIGGQFVPVSPQFRKRWPRLGCGAASYNFRAWASGIRVSRSPWAMKIGPGAFANACRLSNLLWTSGATDEVKHSCGPCRERR